MIPPSALQERAFVYLLRSLKSGKFYLGWTTDLKRRLQEHNLGESCYTRLKGPWELVGYESFSDVDSAKKRERALKRSPSMLSYFKKRALAAFQAPVSSTSFTRTQHVMKQGKQVVG